jgi:MFS transporter, DHA2 family, multidrug resistance protein
VTPAPRRWWGLAVLSLSLLVVMMDMTILNVALPALSRDVQPSSVELLWIVDAYSLVVGGLLVTASAIGDRIGRRRLLTAGYAIFGAVSLLVLLVDSALGLIAVRALLGIGGAMIMPATLSMIRTLFTDERERGLALGLWAGVAGAGAALGPIVGGALLEVFSWQAAFLVNVPIMVVAVVAALALLPESRPATPGSIDARGVLLSIAGAAALMYAIKQFGKDGLGAGSLIPGVAGALALAAFVRHCLRSPAPMLDVRLLALPKVRAGTLTALTLMVATGGLLLLATQWLQLSEGLSPLESGVALLPMSAAAMLGSLAVPALAERFGPRVCLSGGLLIGGVGLLLPALLPGALSFPVLAAAFALAGLGMGSLAVASGLIMSGTPSEKAGSAAAIEETSYEFGAALSVATLGSLGLAIYRSGLPETAGEQARESLAGALGDPALVAAATSSFADGVVWASFVGGVLMLVAAVAVARLLAPARVSMPREAAAATAAAHTRARP